MCLSSLRNNKIIIILSEYLNGKGSLKDPFSFVLLFSLLLFIVNTKMAFRKPTYGINFPFKESSNGDYLSLTVNAQQEIKSNLIHLLLTKKGSRYMLPDFGTNLHQYLFEPLDDETTSKIENEIYDSVEKYIPSLKIEKIILKKLGDDGYEKRNNIMDSNRIIISLDYSINQKTFEFRDNVTVEI